MRRPSDVLKNVGGVAPVAVEDEDEESLDTRSGEASYGVARHLTKGEDMFKVSKKKKNKSVVYGVFDGHGGSRLAKALSEQLPQRLLRGPTVDAFFDVDAELGPQHENEGSTATCAVVERESPSRATVEVSWVGDSRAIAVEMLDPARPLCFETALHHVSNAAEIDRLERQWGARDGADDDDDLMKRSRDYERRVAACQPAAFVRQKSIVARRRDATGAATGPLVVQALWAPTDDPGNLIRGASTCVTRAIGDWDSSRGLIPYPDVATHAVEAPAWRRYVLATDGLWDVVAPDKARKVVASYADPQRAAQALLRRARKRYARINAAADPFADDTTVLVFDVKLGTPDFVKPKRAAIFSCIPSKHSQTTLDQLLDYSSSSSSRRSSADSSSPREPGKPKPPTSL
ncbi:hypothetical protein CTAYLR_007307 [Chrysophaeum taylorii]|uniref:PPM-type phosphatase domain-containing protein n=1 Tax=Chrysophaeum taylorii TaxID=2483200 RepID=A0AAD7UI50_9STRA|nr:hypothetical protein CTAYLR_007307 [Chrysophaeum taylorii]